MPGLTKLLKKKYVVIGQYLAIGILTAISLSAAFGLNFVPQKYVGLLGFIPIALGVKEWISYKRPAQNKSNRKEFPLETEKNRSCPPQQAAEYIAECNIYGQ